MGFCHETKGRGMQKETQQCLAKMHIGETWGGVNEYLMSTRVRWKEVGKGKIDELSPTHAVRWPHCAMNTK